MYVFPSEKLSQFLLIVFTADFLGKRPLPKGINMYGEKLNKHLATHVSGFPIGTMNNLVQALVSPNVNIGTKGVL